MDCFASIAMTLKYPIRPIQIAKFFPSALMASPFELPISSPTTSSTEWGNGETATQARRVHAAGLYSHRRVALSRGLAGCQLQFPAYQKTDPEAGSRKIRRLFHGRPSGRAEHAGQCAQAQPHRDLVPAVHAVVGAGRRHPPYPTDRDGFDYL